jgi:type I restriction enzyme M protein
MKLMALMILEPITKQITDSIYQRHDVACGTGGMLTVADETLLQLAREHSNQVSVHLLGQEINAGTYAINKIGASGKLSYERSSNYASTRGRSCAPYSKSAMTDKRLGRATLVDVF